MIKKIFDNKTNITSRSFKKVRSYAFYGALAVGAGLMMSEIAFASRFDIDAGVTAGTKPVIKALTDHWGKGVLISGAATAMIGEGDLRQRGIRAAMGSTIAGIAVLGLIAMLSA